MRVLIIFDMKTDPFKPWLFHIEPIGHPPYTGRAPSFDNVWKQIKDYMADKELPCPK